MSAESLVTAQPMNSTASAAAAAPGSAPGSAPARLHPIVQLIVSWRGWLVFAVLSVIATGWSAAQVLTSTLAEYDDEGYVMMSLDSYLSGRPLYTETYTQYGPAHYQLMKGLHTLTGWPVNHHTTRGKTWCVWLLVAGLSAAIVYRLTNHLWMSLATYLAVGCHLDKLCLEPGHPQETCLLGVLATVLAATWWQPGRVRSAVCSTLVMGVATGTVMMTKLNVGGLLLVSVMLGFLLRGGPRPLSRLRLAGVACGLMILPAVLCQQAWHQGWTVGLPLVVTLGVAAVCWWSDESARASQPISLAWLISYGTVVTATCVGFALLTLAEGTQPADLFYGLVTQHVGFDRFFYHAAPVLWPALVAGLALLYWLPRWQAYPTKFLPRISGAGVWIVGGLVFGFLLSTGRAAQSGLELRGFSSWLISFGPLLAWAIIPHPAVGTAAAKVLAGKEDQYHSTPHLGACVLALVSCVMPLMAYPTPGTQVELGTLCSLLALMVLVSHRWHAGLINSAESRLLDEPSAGSSANLASGNHETRTSVEEQRDSATNPAVYGAGSSAATVRLSWQGMLRAYPAFGLAVLLLAVVVDRDVRWTWRRLSYEPLGLPGAEWLRLPAEQARQQRALVAALQQQPLATFVFAQHGQNRFYFWTGLRPPTGFNATFWPYMLTEAQQSATIAQLAQMSPTCVVALEQGDALYPRGRVLPLRDYLRSHYQPAESVGMWRIWRAGGEAGATLSSVGSSVTGRLASTGAAVRPPSSAALEED